MVVIVVGFSSSASVTVCLFQALLTGWKSTQAILVKQLRSPKKKKKKKETSKGKTEKMKEILDKKPGK